MALTVLQRRVCQLLADRRRRAGESYVAGGAALNELVGGARRSRDVDLFHARAIVDALPADQAGRCVLDHEGRLGRAPAAALPDELAAGRVVFHAGVIRGAFPEVRGPATP